MSDILNKAQAILQRKEKEHEGYGIPEESMRRASIIASEICCKYLSPQDVVKVLMAVKLSREAHNHKEDNLVDLVSYASILNDMHR